MNLFGPPDVEKLRKKGDFWGLVKALSYKKDSSIRCAAADALGRTRAYDAVSYLLARLRDDGEDAAVKEAAKEALVPCLIGALFMPLNTDSVKVSMELLREIGADAVPSLIMAFDQTNHWFVHHRFAVLLGEIGDARAIPFLIEQLFYTPGKGDAAFDALLLLGPAAIPALVEALNHHESLKTRQRAAELLDSLAWTPSNDEERARYAVVKQDWKTCRSLGSVAVEPLIFLLQHGVTASNDPDGAVSALGLIGDPRAVQPLVDLLWKVGPGTTERLVDALVWFGDASVRPLIVKLQSLPPDELDYQHNKIRYSAVLKAMKRIGAPAVEALTVELGSENWLGRVVAAKVLDELGWKPGLDTLGANYWIAKHDCEKCVEIGAAAVEPLLTWGLRYARHSAISALAQICDPRAADALIEALWAPLEVRRDAAQALVLLYHEGSLSAEQKQRLLEKRQHIESAHQDVTTYDEPPQHYDREEGWRSTEFHQDSGVGVPFPL